MDTINALASLIQKRSQYTKYISHLLQTLCGTLVGGSSLSALVIQNELMLHYCFVSGYGNNLHWTGIVFGKLAQSA